MRTTGLDSGSISTGVATDGVHATVLFGWIIDQGHPGWVFGLLDIFTAIGLIAVLFPKGSLTV